MSHLILAAPVFLVYQVGLLLSPNAANGVDAITRMLGYLAGLSWTAYLIVMAGLVLVYVLVLKSLSRSQKFDPGRFPKVLLEATVYAVLMGPVAGLLLRKIHVLGRMLDDMGLLDRVIASAGAGFYEELVFRLILLGALVWFLQSRGMARWGALLISFVVSSLIFSAVHYIGPGSDPFELTSFSYRAVLGLMLAAIFTFRGFATAVYAHALYDVYVMCILMA